MIHFVTHITSAEEIERLPSLRDEVAKFFPGSRLHVFNQTLLPVDDTIVCENIKSCGFGWTLRFLRYALELMIPDDVVIKIDPDTEIWGNPIAGLEIPPGYVFGQFMSEVDSCVSVFFGGFQGYTYDAATVFLERAPLFENQPGPQDIIAQQIINVFEIPFLVVPNIELWSMVDPLPTTLMWHPARGNRQGNCK